MRCAIFFVLLLLPHHALGWTFTPVPLCTLSHANGAAEITIVHNPAVPEYALTLALTDAQWATSPVFSMSFEGGRALTISTNRHATEGPTLSVRDRGFGNVLDGLEFNTRVRALTDRQGVAFSLSGAAEPVRQFRECVRGAPALS